MLLEYVISERKFGGQVGPLYRRLRSGRFVDLASVAVNEMVRMTAQHGSA